MAMNRAIDITPAQRDELLSLLASHLPNTEAWVYGSRVRWTSRPESDLDLVVFATPAQAHGVSALRDALEESDLPFRVDLFVWDEMSDAFRAQIEQEHVVLVNTVDEAFRKVIYRESLSVQYSEECSEDDDPKRISAKEQWIEMPFANAVMINPTVPLERGMTYPFVDMAAVNDGSRCVYAADRRVYRGGGSRFQSGDTLMARITPCLENGKIARFCSTASPATAHGSTEFIVIRGRSGITDSEFAYYLTRWSRVRNYAIEQMTGTSGRQRVLTSSLSYLEIPIPPLPEQRGIARILGALDDKIALNRRMNETLEAMARAIFKDWFVDFGPTRAKAEGRAPYLAPDLWGLFPDALDNERKPVGWEIRKLEDFLELAYGKSLPAKRRVPGKIPVYGSGGVTGTHDTPLIEGPAVIVGRKGTVGSLYWDHRSIFPIDTVFYVVPRIGTTLFSYHLLSTQPLQDMNTDAAVPELNRSNAYRLEFPQPPSELIAEFEDVAHAIWERRAKNLEEIETLSETRDLLLPKLLSGEIRLREAEQAIEAVA